MAQSSPPPLKLERYCVITCRQNKLRIDMHTLKIMKRRINKIKYIEVKKIFRNYKVKLGWQGILPYCWKLRCSTYYKGSLLF